MKTLIMILAISLSLGFERDLASFSRHSAIFQTHLDFDLTADVDQKVLKGRVDVSFYRLTRNSTKFYLDTKDCIIGSVSDLRGNLIPFQVIDSGKPEVGNGLLIEVPLDGKLKGKLSINYSTTTQSTGVHFSSRSLRDSQYEFMYTHGEAILARSYFPCQDTPALKVTSTAILTVKKPYTALFTGIMTREKQDEHTSTFHFSNSMPFSTYLINFAIGKIEKLQLHPKLTVYGESQYLGGARHAFRNFEAYYDFLTSKLGKFRFGTYGFLIVPEDFPFKGTENPYLITLSASVVRRNELFEATIPHEMIHFWAGDLVTNHDWTDFWLNEGITSYLTLKAVKAVYGLDTYLFELDNEKGKLNKALKELKKMNTPANKMVLKPTLGQEDPYSSFSRLPYSKGALFLESIEQKVGEERFFKAFKRYFDTFAKKTATTEQFGKFLRSEFPGIYDSFEFDKWIYTQYLPEIKFTSRIYTQMENTLELLTNKPNLNLVEAENLTRKLPVKAQHILISKLVEKSKNTDASKQAVLDRFLALKLKDDPSLQLKFEMSREESPCERLKLFLSNYLKVRDFSVTFTRKLFMEISKNGGCGDLFAALDTFKNVLNPITFNRVREFLNKP